jgi:hypothetical protein
VLKVALNTITPPPLFIDGTEKLPCYRNHFLKKILYEPLKTPWFCNRYAPEVLYLGL